MNYKLTKHAQEAMEKRRISREWLEHALLQPEWIEPDPVDPALEHRLSAIEEFEGRVLRVIVNVNADPPRVITVYFDRRRKRP
ncbi:MAG: DUF4258 domain-containing protein [bacterium]